MQTRKTKIEAWHDFLSNELNAVPAEVDGGFIIVRRYCSNCRYQMTDRTKNCLNPSSVGCWQFKYKIKETNHENIDN